MDYKEKATILQACSSKKGERCSSCPALGQGFRTCMKNAMKDGAAAIRELLVENRALRNTADGFKKRAEAAEAEIERLRNEHLKIQYGGEELTVQELCTRLKLAECRAITAENDKASLLQNKRTTDLYIRDKHSGRIHRIGDECHDALWVDVDGTVHYSNLQNGDGCADHSQIDPNAGYEFMPSDFGELMMCQIAGED